MRPAMADRDSRAGARYADAAILDWVAEIHVPADDGLARAFAAPDDHDIPAIQLGPSEARLVAMLLRMVGARKVVEIGTLAGYSAIAMARMLPSDGLLVSLESDPRHAAIARENVAAAGVSDRVEIAVGDAKEILPTLVDRGPFCAVFVDADKGSYDEYGRWARANLRTGGLLIGDNAFYFGRLRDEDAAAAAMRRFHEEMAESFDSVCVPTPDGLAIGIKRGKAT